MDRNSPEASEARTRLEAEKARLDELLAELEKNFNQDGGISQSGDAAADTTYADTNIGTRDGIKNELDEVDAALQRLDDGTYGIDEVTGDPINPERLAAEPTARTNVGT